jgi:drug/metabolite transporter (DMT)-like permease
MQAYVSAMKRFRWLAFASLGIIWGSAWIATDSFGEYIPPLHGAAVRFISAALVLIPIILVKRIPFLRGRPLAVALLLSVTMIALPAILLDWSQQRTSSVTVTVLFAAMPFLLTMLAPAPNRAMPATIVGLGGIAYALGATFSLSQASGIAVAFLAVSSAAISALLAHRELRQSHPIMVTFLILGSAGILLLFVSLLLERGESVAWNPSSLGALAFLALVAGAPAYAIYFWLLGQLDAYKVVAVQWVEILAALGEAALSLRAGWSYRMITGAVIAFVSLLVVTRSRFEDDDTVSLIPNS